MPRLALSIALVLAIGCGGGDDAPKQPPKTRKIQTPAERGVEAAQAGAKVLDRTLSHADKARLREANAAARDAGPAGVDAN